MGKGTQQRFDFPDCQLVVKYGKGGVNYSLTGRLFSVGIVERERVAFKLAEMSGWSHEVCYEKLWDKIPRPTE